MISLPDTLMLPMKTDEDGTIHISSTRVTLDTLIARHQQGDSPEAIHAGFPSLPLTDIYAVIAYYLANQAEVDTYLNERDEDAKRVREEIEANYTPEQKARTEYFRKLLAEKSQNKDS